MGEHTFPALDGGGVTEAHARTCREQGHAVHTVDGVDSGVCPRCGEVTREADNSPEAVEARRRMFEGFGWSVTR